MTKRSGVIGLGALAAWALACGGCSQQPMDMSTMKPPARPVELDQLEPWVGRWNATGEWTMDGKTCKVNGTSTIAWECDKRALVEKSESEMEDMGKMSMMVVYTYDTDAKNFKTFFASSMGDANMGEMKRCEKGGCWRISGKGKNPMTGQTTWFEGCIKMPDNSTMEWTWSEWDSWKLKKLGEGKGTAKRV